MKGLLALVLLALLGLTAYNGWQIRVLREDIARLEGKVAQQQSSNLPAEAIAQASASIAQAREAVQKADPGRARAALDQARQKLDTAVRTASDKAAPAVQRLREQATDLSRQLEERFHADR